MSEKLKIDYNTATETSTTPLPVESSTNRVSSIFSRSELKNFFLTYLATMLSIEGLVFFISFISQLSKNESEFPWKPYLFLAFGAPIAVTFIFGVIVLAFDKYFFNTQDVSGVSSSSRNIHTNSALSF